MGCTTYGIDLCTGPSHAAMVAAAVLNPTYLRKSRREVVDEANVAASPKNSSVGISSTNSLFLSVSTIELFSFSSSTLFQYFLFDDIYSCCLIFYYTKFRNLKISLVMTFSTF